MNFTKMHGLGNDYIFVNCFDERVDDPPTLARAVSDRHTGVGGDGLILIRPTDRADVRMEVYNADGSRAEMCGNGIRCVAKYVIEHDLVEHRMASSPEIGRPRPPCSNGHGDAVEVRVEADDGVRLCVCDRVEGTVRAVRVDMGIPSLAASAIPSTISAGRIIDYPLDIHPTEPRAEAIPTEPRASARANISSCCTVTCVSMGNPHAVVFVENLDAVALQVVGPQIEHAPQFPERINVHFARVDSPDHVTVRTWERGSGATRACGTGACAVCVAGAVADRTGRKITVTLPGGDLEVEWADDDRVYMTGPAVEVFTGHWPD
jgi:diaminopimelate epimerase